MKQVPDSNNILGYLPPDLEPIFDILKDTIALANKAHICNACNSFIDKGTYYRSCSGETDYKKLSYSWCLSCSEKIKEKSHEPELDA